MFFKYYKCYRYKSYVFCCCSGVLVVIDSDNLTEVNRVLKYFARIPGRQPIQTALLDDGLLLIYEHRKSKLSMMIFTDIIFSFLRFTVLFFFVFV